MRKNLVILFALCSMICFADLPVFALDHPVEVSVQYDGTYLLVPVIVGKHNVMFILDTAAGGSVISPATRDLLGFTDKDGQTADIVGAGGSSQYQSLKIPNISFGGYSRNNFNVTVIDLKKFQKKEGGEPYAGILGNDFLKNFDVEINMPASKMYLYPHDGEKANANPKIKKKPGINNIAEAEGFIAFNLFVKGESVMAILDSGSPASILNWRAANRIGVTPETKGVVKRAQGTGGLGTQKAETFLYTFKNVKAGKNRFGSAEMQIADLSIFKALGLNEKPAMIFGLSMLKRNKVFISYSTKQIYFY